MAKPRDSDLILGTGIDIIETDRIKHSVEKFGDKFLSRVFTGPELEYCLSKKNIYPHLAARFTAKEAIVKALSSVCSNGFSWRDMNIINGDNGLPSVELSGKLKKCLPDKAAIKISMSHSRDYATSIAILYKTISP